MVLELHCCNVINVITHEGGGGGGGLIHEFGSGMRFVRDLHLLMPTYVNVSDQSSKSSLVNYTTLKRETEQVPRHMRETK